MPKWWYMSETWIWFIKFIWEIILNTIIYIIKRMWEKRKKLKCNQWWSGKKLIDKKMMLNKLLYAHHISIYIIKSI